MPKFFPVLVGSRAAAATLAKALNTCGVASDQFLIAKSMDALMEHLHAEEPQLIFIDTGSHHNIGEFTETCGRISLNARRPKIILFGSETTLGDWAPKISEFFEKKHVRVLAA